MRAQENGALVVYALKSVGSLRGDGSILLLSGEVLPNFYLIFLNISVIMCEYEKVRAGWYQSIAPGGYL